MPRRDSAHRVHELLEPPGLAVELSEHGGACVFDLVLRAAGAEAFGQIPPEPVQAAVGHFQEAAHVVGAVVVKEGRRFTRVAISRTGTFAVALEET